MGPEIVCVAGEEALEEIRTLFREYAEALQVDLCFQQFDAELASLPGSYAPPQGRLLLAIQEGRPAGCVGLRPLSQERAEAKRLYVRPAFRGGGVGRALLVRLAVEAREIGYREIVGDTLPDRMAQAQGLYASLGFEDIEPYYHNPIPGARYVRLKIPEKGSPLERR